MCSTQMYRFKLFFTHMDISTLLSFAFISWLLVISPGPNGVLIAKTVPTSGRNAGLANVAGFFASFYVHGTLSILGISLILIQSAQAFFIVKMLGAAYLCWIGIKSLLGAFKGIEVSKRPQTKKAATTIYKGFIEGFVTSTLNPKVSMFYLAAFPQFVTQAENTYLQAFTLVLIHSTLNLIWFSAMVLVFARLTGVANNGNFQRWVKGVTGVVFIGFGARLAFLKP